jgi:hypothetical protein
MLEQIHNKETHGGGAEGALLSWHDRIQDLVSQSVRSAKVGRDLYWVVLNLPDQSSCTLYIGSSGTDAALAEATARGAVIHALEYALHQ